MKIAGNDIFGLNIGISFVNLHTKNHLSVSIDLARIDNFLDFLKIFNGNLWTKILTKRHYFLHDNLEW